MAYELRLPELVEARRLLGEAVPHIDALHLAEALACGLGFACHDATCPNFFGPTGVDPNERMHGIGKALLFNCLEAMKQQGYGYAIIGGVGPAEFYAKTVGAIPIEGSEPGVYRGLL